MSDPPNTHKPDAALHDIEQHVQVAIGSFVNVAPAPDGVHTVFVFQIGANSTVGVALPPKDFSGLLSTALKSAAESAAISAANIQNGTSVISGAVPITVASIGISPGRSSTEALLALQIGPLTLTFAAELSMLEGTLENLKKITSHVPLQKPN